MSELKPCPCGAIPESLCINENGQGRKWAEASHCDWSVEFRTNYHPIDSDECKQLAAEAWNLAPRDKRIEELKPQQRTTRKLLEHADESNMKLKTQLDAVRKKHYELADRLDEIHTHDMWLIMDKALEQKP